MKMKVTYDGGMKFTGKVRGHEIVIDQPKEGGGSDLGPTPPELFVASLASCVGVYAAFYCNTHEISIEGMELDVEWEKAERPTRVGKVAVSITIPGGVPQEMRERVVTAAKHCLIHNTLENHPEVIVELKQ